MRQRLNDSLAVYYTGTMGSGSTVLEQQRANSELRFEELRELKGLVGELEDALLSGYPDALGETLHKSWHLKKQLAKEITNPLIDNMYETAIRAGAIGGKVSGAGGRGFLLLYVPPERELDVRAALRGFRKLPIRLAQEGTRVLINLRQPASQGALTDAIDRIPTRAEAAVGTKDPD